MKDDRRVEDLRPRSVEVGETEEPTLLSCGALLGEHEEFRARGGLRHGLDAAGRRRGNGLQRDGGKPAELTAERSVRDREEASAELLPENRSDRPLSRESIPVLRAAQVFDLGDVPGNVHVR